MRRPDGSEEPDYGCVFWSPAERGALSWWFDRRGRRFCRLTAAMPAGGWLVSQRRAFRIAGPTRP